MSEDKEAVRQLTAIDRVVYARAVVRLHAALVQLNLTCLLWPSSLGQSLGRARDEGGKALLHVDETLASMQQMINAVDDSGLQQAPETLRGQRAVMTRTRDSLNEALRAIDEM